MTTDRRDRPLRNLRISVTDRCNLRCHYCMPEKDYEWLPREDLLEFEEIRTLASVFADLGVDRLRLTGGEPLIRKDLAELVAMLAGEGRIRDIALTTNGVYLPEQAEALRRAGLNRVTISLDSLDRARFKALAGRDQLDKVLAGITHAAEVGFEAIKINTVVIRGENDREAPALLAFARDVGAEVRFIEYMDVGGATAWRRDRVFPRNAILDEVRRQHGPIEPLAENDSAPADRWRLADGTIFGVISSTTQPFCSACDRSRLTADGTWFLCLYARHGIDLRSKLRSGTSPGQLREFISTVWGERQDQGAVDRLALKERGVLADGQDLKSNPHLEMHTRGG